MTFKILSLDGGGIRGVVSATILKEVEKVVREQKNKPLHEYFDLIAGTSTGSILAVAIACRKSASELMKLYCDRGDEIFLKSVRQQRKWRKLTPLFGSYALYPNQPGEKGLAEVLAEELVHPDLGKEKTTIANMRPGKEELSPYLLILAYDVLSRNTTWFSNDDPTAWYCKNNIPLWEICSASAAAPTFFPPYNLRYKNDRFLPHIDGGVAANNPELSAIAHALWMENEGTPKSMDEIAVLSIGTGETSEPYEYEEIKKWETLKWAANIPNIFLNPPAENSAAISHSLFLALGSQHHLRLDFDLNKRLTGEQQTDFLRHKLGKKDLYNEYIFKKTGEKKYVDENIDNPDACEGLIEATTAYLDCGTIPYPDRKDLTRVQEAIAKFIDCHD